MKMRHILITCRLLRFAGNQANGLFSAKWLSPPRGDYCPECGSDMKGKNTQPSLPADESLAERHVWEAVEGTWKPLHSHYYDKGFSLEWHEFHLNHDMDWGKSFHEGSMEICLNYSGNGELWQENKKTEISSKQIGYYVCGDGLKAQRISGSIHRFLTIELSVEYLRQILSGTVADLKKDVSKFIENPLQSTLMPRIEAMPTMFMPLKMAVLEPPVHKSARSLWYQSKIMEVVSSLFFREDTKEELFCHRQKRMNRDRIEKVLFLLDRDFENPPSLQMLSDEVGCSPFYLSRLFSQETGMSIPKYLRVKRIEKAAEYLRSGEMNVTEAAMAVGYSSLSAFNKAFVEQVGCCPGLYPNARLLMVKKGSAGSKEAKSHYINPQTIE